MAGTTASETEQGLLLMKESPTGRLEAAVTLWREGYQLAPWRVLEDA